MWIYPKRVNNPLVVDNILNIDVEFQISDNIFVGVEIPSESNQISSYEILLNRFLENNSNAKYWKTSQICAL